MKKLCWSSSSGDIEIEYTKKQAYSIPASGDAEAAVTELMLNVKFMNQFVLMVDNIMIKVLTEYGTWDRDDLGNRKNNIMKLIWISSLDLQEENNK